MSDGLSDAHKGDFYSDLAFYFTALRNYLGRPTQKNREVVITAANATQRYRNAVEERLDLLDRLDKLTWANLLTEAHAYAHASDYRILYFHSPFEGEFLFIRRHKNEFMVLGPNKEYDMNWKDKPVFAVPQAQVEVVEPTTQTVVV